VITVEQSRLEAATSFVAQACMDAVNPAMEWARLYASPTSLMIVGVGASVTVGRVVPAVKAESSFDVCVQADRLAACVKGLSSGAVGLALEGDGTLRVVQGGTEVGFETKPASEALQVPGFEEMAGTYQGPNPTEVFDSIRHVAAAHPGNTPLAEVLIMMSGRSYLAGTLSSVRCDGSLVGPQSDAVLTVKAAGLWPLARMSGQISAYHDKNRILITDEFGYATIQKWSGELGNFPARVSQVFSSLRQTGQVKVSRGEFLKAVIAANGILKPLTKEEVFLECVCTKEKMTISASVGRHSFRQQIEVSSSGSFRIPIHVSRLLAFLKNSTDENVYIQVMDSEVVQSPRSFVHMTDSKLHEAIAIPKPKEIEVLA
jgi:hypothetical protein